MKDIEISISSEYMYDEEEIQAEYIKACVGNDGMFVDTSGMSMEDSYAMCSIKYKKDRASIMGKPLEEMTEYQNSLPEGLKTSVAKWREKQQKLYAADKESQKMYEQAYAAQKYFGGKKRKDLKDSDFLFPQDRSFPIVTPQDVPDAVSNFGRKKGNMSYEDFKKKLVNFTRKKGKDFVAALPDTIKEEYKISNATQIAKFVEDYVDPEKIGTIYEDQRPINKEGYIIDMQLKKKAKEEKLKNPDLQSVSPPTT